MSAVPGDNSAAAAAQSIRTEFANVQAAGDAQQLCYGSIVPVGQPVYGWGQPGTMAAAGGAFAPITGFPNFSGTESSSNNAQPGLPGADFQSPFFYANQDESKQLAQAGTLTPVFDQPNGSNPANAVEGQPTAPTINIGPRPREGGVSAPPAAVKPAIENPATNTTPATKPAEVNTGINSTIPLPENIVPVHEYGTYPAGTDKITERPKAALTEAAGDNSDAKKANAALKIYTEGSEVKVAVDPSKLIKNSDGSYQCPVWAQDDLRGNNSAIHDALVKAKQEFKDKGIDLQTQLSGIPPYLTSKIDGTPGPNIEPIDDSEKPNPTPAPQPGPDGGCKPNPPDSNPGPNGDTEKPEDPNADTNKPDTNKPDANKFVPSEELNWINKNMTESLARSMNPYTALSYPVAVMPKGLKDIYARHKLSNPPTKEEMDALQKDLKDYFDNPQNASEIEQFKKNIDSSADRLANGPLKDQAGADEMKKFWEQIKNPGVDSNRETIANLASTLQTGNPAGLPDGLKKAIVNLGITNLAATDITMVGPDGRATTQPLFDLTKMPKDTSSQEYKDAATARLNTIKAALEGRGQNGVDGGAYLNNLSNAQVNGLPVLVNGMYMFRF